MNTPVCLTIAGNDSGGEAGIQADLQTFGDFNCHGLSAITALTAQNPTDILSVNPTNPIAFQDQLRALKSYFTITHIKTGLLPNIPIMEAILKFIPENTILVSDPLISSTSGKRLMDSNSLTFFKNHFLKRVNYLTPNIPELEILSSKKFSKTSELNDTLSSFQIDGIFLKGGHSQNPGTDYFYDGRLWKMEAPQIEIKSSHGTGCRISSAFCAALANGEKILDAACSAKNYVYHALNSCRKTNLDQWLLGSPGKAEYLEKKIYVSEIK